MPISLYYALVDINNIVQNRIIWDGVETPTWDSSLTAIVDPTGISVITGTWNGTTFIPPPLATPDPSNPDSGDVTVD